MAVPGRRIQSSSMSDSISKASDEDHDTSCQPCLFDGNNVATEGFCQTCSEYLCKTCLNVHRKQSATRGHVIIQNDQMPKGQSKVQDIYSEPCKIHAGGIVKFYCEVHEVVGCGDCMVLEHKSCKVDLVADVSVGYIGGQKQSEIGEYVNKFENKINETKKSLKSAEGKISECFSKAMDDIKTFRKQVNAYLDKVEADTVKEAMEIKTDQEKKLTDMKSELKSVEDEVAEFNRKRNKDAKDSSVLFVIDHITKARLESLEIVIQRVHTDNSSMNYVFESNDDINCLLQSLAPMGDIRFQKANINDSDKVMEMEATFTQSSEFKSGFITGSTVVSSGQLALVDNLSDNLKLFDIKDCKIITSLPLLHLPWDVTVSKHNELAATVPKQKVIQFIAKSGKNLKEAKRQEVGGECYGIANNDNKLIVSYLNPCKIEILNTDCRVLETIVSAERGSELFEMPRYIDICPSTSNIYVSDYKKHEVTIMTIDGHPLTTFRDKEVHSPQGLVTLANGAFFVASYGRTNVQLVSPDCDKKKIILKQNDGIKWPLSVCFVSQENTLFVSNNNGNKIDVTK